MENKKLTKDNKHTLLLSVETLCLVAHQRIIKNKEYRCIRGIDDIKRLYNDIIITYPVIKNELSQLMIDHYRNTLRLAREKRFVLVTDKFENEINFLQEKIKNDEI